MIAAHAPHLHDGLPGAVFLVLVAIAGGIVLGLAVTRRFPGTEGAAPARPGCSASARPRETAPFDLDAGVALGPAAEGESP